MLQKWINNTADYKFRISDVALSSYDVCQIYTVIGKSYPVIFIVLGQCVFTFISGVISSFSCFKAWKKSNFMGWVIDVITH